MLCQVVWKMLYPMAPSTVTSHYQILSSNTDQQGDRSLSQLVSFCFSNKNLLLYFLQRSTLI